MLNPLATFSSTGCQNPKSTADFENRDLIYSSHFEIQIFLSCFRKGYIEHKIDYFTPEDNRKYSL
jgi:hypothetical protein